MIPSKPKPFLKWAGGKTQLLPQIEAHLPTLFASGRRITYIEPFVGGGAVVFHLLQKYPNIRHAVINDINPHLISAYRAIKDTPAELISLLEEVQSTYRSLRNDELQKEYFLSMRERFNKGNLPQTDDAACMIFLNRTCFNGLYRENSKGEFNVAFGRYANPGISEPSLIRADSELLKRVEILHGDFSQTAAYFEEDCFFYFDPPYRPITATSFTSYSKENFNDREQRRLKTFYTEMSEQGGHLLLSNSDGGNRDDGNTYIDDLYSDYIITRVYARRSISRSGNTRGPIPELLIRNYRKIKEV